ncbi:sugar transferase [Leuconostoc lactis]|uniref:sugar transferase n=1 Tax=Leuconostoc lactis TaxID=1246 RepID=UPI0015F76C4F|nr:sugar transferase [Leuconostoc lactis]MBA5812978.1 sugar transferase [Leuconostoc lactis]
MKFKVRESIIRLIDIVGALIGLSVSAVLILIIGLFVRRDGGNVFFKQNRVGLNGKRFVMWKIRSMVVDAEIIRQDLIAQSDVDGMFKMKDDPRITPVGKFIRKHSLDELPQFWNVLKGDMSLVGPRPALEEEYGKYTEVEKKRLKVKPGLTGLWQVSGRSNVDFDTMISLDLDYIAHRSVWLNIAILAKTVWLIFPSDKNGAY